VAQDIFRELTDLHAYIDVHGKRWILELIQNALDVARDGGVDISVNMHGSILTFSHNGRAFTEKELIHLIYHGSTKVDEKGSSGKLGTGFLATHLLSPEVTVKGCLCDQQKFEFTLDREANTVAELTDKMRKTWNDLLKSLAVAGQDAEKLTVYEYKIDTPAKIGIYRQGLDILRETAPILLGLDNRLNTITVSQDGETFKWIKTLRPDGGLVDVQLLHNGLIQNTDICSIAILTENNISIAVPLCRKNGKLAVFDTYDLPKLYYPLPLIGSASFPSPFLISNRDFIPTKDREGILLTTSMDREVDTNKKLIGNAFALFPKVIENVCKSNYEDLHLVSKLHRMDELESRCSKWLDKNWTLPMVARFIETIRSTPILMTNSGLKQPRTSKIPYFSDKSETSTAQIIDMIWILSTSLFPESVPTKESYQSWQEIRLFPKTVSFR